MKNLFCNGVLEFVGLDFGLEFEDFVFVLGEGFWLIGLVGGDKVVGDVVVGLVGVVVLEVVLMVFLCSWLISCIEWNFELWIFCCVVVYVGLFL